MVEIKVVIRVDAEEIARNYRVEVSEPGRETANTVPFTELIECPYLETSSWAGKDV